MPVIAKNLATIEFDIEVEIGNRIVKLEMHYWSAVGFIRSGE
jgi:hypothetical protein